MFIRPLIEGVRVVGLVILFGLLLLFATTGITQLYLDWSSLTAEDIDGLIPSVAELEAAWKVHGPTLMDDHIPATMWATRIAQAPESLPPLRETTYPPAPLLRK